MVAEIASREIIDQRFVLGDEQREGGMGRVIKAYDLQTSNVCAIKLFNLLGDSPRLAESFNREWKALKALAENKNIVSVLDAGKYKESYYVALEWMEQNLETWIDRRGKIKWGDYFETIGRPVIEAVSFAHNRNWIHRDLKPSNILISDKDIPKVSDFGIARLIDRPRIGITFQDFSSPPYTAPEQDDGGEYSKGRDCFSLAAITVFCLTGKKAANYAELRNLLSELDPVENPVDILSAALSDEPKERPILASALLADLDVFETERQSAKSPALVCYLRLAGDAMGVLQRSFGVSESSDIETLIESELNEAVGVRATSAETNSGWIITAVTWWFEVVRTPSDSPYLTIKKAFRSKASEAERAREGRSIQNVEFSFSPPRDLMRAISALDHLTAKVIENEHMLEMGAEQAQSDAYFKTWHSYLNARANLEIKREKAIEYESLSVDGSTIVLRTAHAVSQELIGQSRFIRAGSTRIFGDIVDTNFDEIKIAVTYGSPASVPNTGKLELNTFAAEKAIERQRSAIDSVRYGRAARPSLKNILIAPDSAKEISIVAPYEPTDPHIDEEKIRIISKALAAEDVLVVKGPPGTGKTKLITELIAEAVARNPKSRILLSSQTHVALDNVVRRLGEKKDKIDIVRIGKIDDPKISADSQPLLLERKVEAWAIAAAKRAQEYLKHRAAEDGIDAGAVEIGINAERLRILLKQLNELEAFLRGVEGSIESAGSAGDLGPVDDEKIDQTQEEISDGKKSLTKLQQQIDEVRQRLMTLGGYGAELANQSESELREWAQILLGESPEHAKFRRLLELQEEWVLRLGRSSEFFAAMLSTAQVVAGTCLGIAGIKGSSAVQYDLCIIDEASKATVPEVLVPMARSRKWILVGDPHQLPPFVEDGLAEYLEDLSKAEVQETLLDRFIKFGRADCVEQLRNQHRMVKGIGDLISNVFYENELISKKKKPDFNLPAIVPRSVTWLSTSAEPHRREVKVGLSFRNDLEAKQIRDLLSRINFVAEKRKATYSVAIIAGYVSQVRCIDEYIMEMRERWLNLDIKCNTVDAFQGDEADICIYSVVRSNRDGKIGFLKEKPRLNVALSRGRNFLIIVGDDVFCRDAVGADTFRKVVDYIVENVDSCELRAIQ